MKFIYVAKKDCKYFWDTASSTRDECSIKLKQICERKEYLNCVICLVELKDLETHILI